MSPAEEQLKALVPIGYIAWDTGRKRPHEGKRRFKVWTTEREAMPCKRPGVIVVPVYAEPHG